MLLFEDQAEFVTNLSAAFRSGKRSVLGVASPAFGKTVVAGHIIATAHDRKSASAWFLVHRKNLLRQTSKSFWAAKITHGLMMSGRRISTHPIQIGTIGTAYNRYQSMKAPTILFVDEAHLAKGNMFETVIKWALANGSLVIGLTGTPIRLDGKPLGDLFEVLIEARPTHWLIEQGRLSKYEMYTTPHAPDLSGVKVEGGDYNREQLTAVMSDRVLVGDAIEHWKKLANGMRTIVYCCGVHHSKKTAEAFNAAGIPAVHVDGESTEAQIKDACEGIADGRYLVLCNCELVIEGFDLASQVGREITIECCVLLRPTRSVARYLQMVFRALRRKPHPAVILDHAGCAMEHGLPDDERGWTLDGRKMREKQKAETFAVRQCPMCYNVYRATLNECPKCNAAAEKTQREIEIIEGQLQKIEIDKARKEQRKEVGHARTLHDLIGVGIRRGMKNPAAWAAHTVAARAGTAPDFAEARRVHAAILLGDKVVQEVF